MGPESWPSRSGPEEKGIQGVVTLCQTTVCGTRGLRTRASLMSPSCFMDSPTSTRVVPEGERRGREEGEGGGGGRRGREEGEGGGEGRRGREEGKGEWEGRRGRERKGGKEGGRKSHVLASCCLKERPPLLIVMHRLSNRLSVSGQ